MNSLQDFYIEQVYKSYVYLASLEKNKTNVIYM